MTIREQVVQDLASLNEVDLLKVSEYLAFLRYRARFREGVAVSEVGMAALYAEFADEDRELAQEGMADYADGLAVEDSL